MRNIKLTFSCFRNLGRSAGGSGGRFLKQPQSGFVIEDLDLDHGGADIDLKYIISEAKAREGIPQKKWIPFKNKPVLSLKKTVDHQNKCHPEIGSSNCPEKIHILIYATKLNNFV